VARFAIGELIRDEEAAFSADVHALEAGVPADDDSLGAVGEGDGLAAGMVVGGVELGAVGEPAGVADGVPLLRLGERTLADDGVDVLQRVESSWDSRNSGDFGDWGCRRGMMAGGCAFVGYGLDCGLGCRGYGGQQDEREQRRLHWNLCFWKWLGERDGWIVEVFAQEALGEGLQVFSGFGEDEGTRSLGPLKLEAGGGGGDPELADGSIWREDEFAGAVFEDDVEDAVVLFGFEGFGVLFGDDEGLLEGFEGAVGFAAERCFVEHSFSLARVS
jgi:hypothetical protein